MKIYTYQLDRIPPITEAINQEINSLEAIASDLIIKCAGNFHALQKLYQILDDLKDTCDLNLCQIEIIADEKQK